MVLVAIALIVIVLILVILLFIRKNHAPIGVSVEQLRDEMERIGKILRDESTMARQEVNANAKLLREEVVASIKSLGEFISGTLAEINKIQKGQLDSFSEQLVNLTKANDQKFEQLRSGISGNMSVFNESILKQISELSQMQKNQLDTFSKQIIALTQSNEQKLESLRGVVEQKLKDIQADNSLKLEQMRATVDEKLHETLEKRLGESFQLVRSQLDLVGQGLGEMKVLATGVGDLKKVLTNIKTRGTWGEIQLGNLLEQILAPEQYGKNVTTKKGSRENVEFALKLPGKEDHIVWLPIDAKFPKEDYERLLSAQDVANAVLVDEAIKAIEIRVKQEAKDIRDKYLDPPNTTDFGVLFLSTEGLYAEVLRIPGLSEVLQREFRVMVAGPTTLAALLNSLQMGFKTLAIEKRASEVWSLLGAVKTEFGKFGDLLDKAHEQITKVGDTIDLSLRKTRTIERKLRDVQVLPAGESTKLIEALPEPEEEDSGQ
ncbi:MAG: DNA recombination protein RmuC [Candidatus Omnitrophica bacterium]|nr:DNA recombination protein RmuC [Candidatus Margulisiibacteriota bacterium]MBU1726376.1 DNA recombination protein RmuC [Candidatus Omnitrophota bacterium]